MAGAGDNASILGRHFFTAAYLMVNHDARTFTMWQANPSTKTNLIPVVSKTTADKGCEPGGGGSASGGSSNGGGNTGDSTTTDKAAPQAISTGVIAGAAAGGTAFIAVVAVLLFFLLRRRKKKKTLPGPASPPAEPSGAQPQDKQEIYAKVDNSVPAEVPENVFYPRELHGASAFSHGDAGCLSARQSNAGPWTPTRPGGRYELDGGWMPHEFRS